MFRMVGCALVWFGGDVLAVPVPVTSHPPPPSVAVVQIEVNGASSLSPSLPLVCSSRFYVSRKSHVSRRLLVTGSDVTI